MSEGEHTAPEDFGAFRERLHQRFESLSPHLQRIARYAVGRPNRLAFQTVAQAASEIRVQPSTLVRFAKRFGFSGYSDMRRLFRLRLVEAEDAHRGRTRAVRGRVREAAGGSPIALLHALADASVLGIRRLAADIDAGALAEAVRLMRAAECIHVLGRGGVQPVAACLAQGLIRRHRRCLLLDAVPGSLSEQVAAMTPTDLVIAAVSESDSVHALGAIAAARARKVPVIVITDAVLGPLARHASVSLVIGDGQPDRVSPLAPHIVLAQSLAVVSGNRPATGHVAGARTP